MREFFKPVSHPVEFVDALLPVYKKNTDGHQNTPSIISIKDLPKWSNKKVIDLGIGDT